MATPTITAATAAWLSGVHASTRTDGTPRSGWHDGRSIGRARARQGYALPSLELALESADLDRVRQRLPTASTRTRFRGGRRRRRCRWKCTRGSCSNGCSETAAARSSGCAQLQNTGSILDSVSEDVARLQRKLGTGRPLKLTEYLDAVRAIEQRIQRAEAAERRAGAAAARPSRPAFPDTFDEHCQADVRPGGPGVPGRHHSRLYAADWLASRATARIPQIGVADGHHCVSHHQHNPKLMAKKAKIERVSHPAVRATSWKAARDARWRRFAAGPRR